EIRLPEECDPAMRRDGLNAKPPAGVGERAWWLEEGLARAPLSAWPQSPAPFIAALHGHQWAPAAHPGRPRAAAVHGDPAWSAALLDALGADARDRALAADLFSLLPIDELIARAKRTLAAGTVAGLGSLLENCPRPWPAELSQLVLNGFAELA